MVGAQRAAWLLSSAAMIAVASADSMVTSFWFHNKCDFDVELADWGVTIPAGQNQNINGQRSSGYPFERISFRPVGGDAYDFIELNGPWHGQGTATSKEHWSYSTYNGFNMGSMYEALNPDGNGYACSDPGAVVDFGSPSSNALCHSGTGYSCQGSTQCGTPISNFQLDHSWVILGDGKWARTSSNGIAGNFWCSEVGGFPPSWLHGGVATLIDCIDNGKPFKLQITTCPTGSSPSPTPSPFPPSSGASCSAHQGCKGLDGDCCPASNGVMLSCCGSSPAPIPTPPSSGASCKAHSACAALDGDCCPTTTGVTLSCCNQAEVVHV